MINNGIDIKRYSYQEKTFDPKEFRQSLSLSDKTRLVGSVGRLTVQKGYEFLIQAAVKVIEYQKNVEFLIIGDGYLMSSLKKLIQKYEISDRFHFLGFRNDAINIIRMLNVFVISSINEGLPIVLLEAMSIGVPVITTNVGEIPSIVKNNYNGIMVERCDVAALSENIIKLLNDELLCKKLSQNSLKMLNKNYSISSMTKEYSRVYKDIIININ